MENQKKYADKKKEIGESRINAWISNKNYEYINELLLSDAKAIKITKGSIIDLALTNLAMSLDSGESLDMIAINHIERLNE